MGYPKPVLDAVVLKGKRGLFGSRINPLNNFEA